MVTYVGGDAEAAPNAAETTLTWPTVQAGDGALLVWSGSSGVTWTPPTGFTLVRAVTADTGTHESRLYQRLCDGTEGGTTITLTHSAANKHNATLDIWRGLHADIIDVYDHRDEDTSGTSHACPQVTPTVDDAPIWTAASERLSGSTAWTAPTGYTARQQPTPIGGGGSLSLASADDGLGETRTAGTPVTPPPWTIVDSTNNVIVWTVALRPDPGPAPPPFPQSVLPLVVEMAFDGVSWTDVTEDVRGPNGVDGVTITRGRSAEGGAFEASRASLTLDDTTGDYSPRNPLGLWYGLLGRNTPLRVRVDGDPDVAYLYAGAEADWVSTPDTAALDVTGDLDLRVDFVPDAARPTGIYSLANRYLTTGDNRSWHLAVTADRLIQWQWSPDGTFAARVTVHSTAALPAVRARGAVRVTLDVDNGAAGNTATFYTAASMAGPWTQLGDPVVTAGTTSVHGGTAPLIIASRPPIALNRAFNGAVYGVQLLDGIDGTVVADPGISARSAGDTSWTGPDGLTWTTAGTARVLEPARFHGEVAEWPTARDITGRDRTVPVQASGIGRRLGQGSPPVQSPLRRTVPDTPGTVAYWPMEESSRTSFGSALPGGGVLYATSGAVNPQADTGFFGSGPLPQMRTGRLVGAVPAYTATGEVTFRFVVHVPTAPPDARLLAQITTSGSVPRWDVWMSSTGSIAVSAYDDAGALLESLVSGSSIVDQYLRVTLNLTQIGGDVQFQLTWYDHDGFFTLFASPVTGTVGRAVSVQVGRVDGLDDVAIGHVQVGNVAVPSVDLRDVFGGFNRETAAARILRLCAENDVPAQIIGEVDDTEAMGPQARGTLLELLGLCEGADGGLLGESRDELGIAYRTRTSMYATPTAVSLSHSGGQFSSPPAGTADDRTSGNDVTMTRRGGASERIVREDGPLSVAAPPEGIGRYPTELTVDVAFDEQLPQLAGWRLHLNTVDEARYPSMAVNLAQYELTADPSASAGLVAVDIGDRVEITGMDVRDAPDGVVQRVLGYSEQLAQYTRAFVVHGGPGRAWDVAYVDDGDEVLGRVDTDGSELAGAVDATGTSLSVAVTAGPIWTTDAAEFPLDIRVGGEVMTVTAITGASSPQTFTVTRAANGVVKSHAIGADLRLATPLILAL